ncbi:MAG TPA: peptide chain release factor N(5)-glutamine methyltransferase [Chitinophagales bacterium]|nr:peptide chain release factor N(5)-glutamine methyltransferase [Chitinophagales bacterium]
MNVLHYKNIVLPMLVESFDEREAENLFKFALEDYFKKRYFDIKDYSLNDDEIEELNYIYEKISNHYPIQYIFNSAHFYGSDFYVDENVLIPRPETEELVHLILSENKQERLSVLDIGTGSGCIAVSLKKHRNEWNIFAIDNSENALEVAKVNALKNHTEIEFFNHDILQSTAFSVDARLYMETEDAPPLMLDIIVSNPPYIPLKEKEKMSVSTVQFEPHTALFTDDANPLLFYDKIADFATEHLTKHGKLYFELNEFNAESVNDLLHLKGFHSIAIHKDLAGKDRMLLAQR